MDEEFETGYQALLGFSEHEEDEVEDAPPGDHDMRIVADKNRGRWNHIENLDDFFTRIYQYHQRSGFACMILQDVMQLVQFAFVVVFPLFLWNCVDYNKLFEDRRNATNTHRINIGDGIRTLDQCVDRFTATEFIFLTVAVVVWIFRLLKVVYNILQYHEIRAFYTTALAISANDLSNMTWHEVQKKLLEVQKDQQMCIHKTELSQLDIYHRILRFKNYMIAMVNKDVLPIKHRLPFVGEITFLTTGLRYNMEIILFWGPWAPFENYWHLNPEYKILHNRLKLAEYLSRMIVWVGVANFVLMPLIFLWQILYSFFRYGELVRRQPGALGARRFSMYSRLYLRHFNELEHEFTARINRGYRFASIYMDSFTTPFLTIIAKFLAFFAGAILAVLLILAVIDEVFLSVGHVVIIMAVLAAIVAICRSLIPNENMIWCPEILMRRILAQIHYIPDAWKGNAHTYKVRDEFAQLFQYKVVYLLEEILSPLVTPFILCFSLRKRALAIVDFYRHHTVDVIGVGDVCAFAQMDIRKHGNPQWVPEERTEATEYEQAEGGKVELSLLHFTVTNPEYKPPPHSQAFMDGLRSQVERDAAMLSLQPLDIPLSNSLHSVTGYGYTSILNSLAAQSLHPAAQSLHPVANSNMVTSTRSGGSGVAIQRMPIRGDLKNSEGPIGGSVGSGGLLSSLHQSVIASHTSTQPNQSMLYPSMHSTLGASNYGVEPHARPTLERLYDEDTKELLSNDMAFSSLYLHAIHDKRVLNPFNPYFDDEDAHQRELWSTEGQSTQRHLPDVSSSQLRDQQGHDGSSQESDLIDVHQVSHGATVHFVQTEQGLPHVPGPYGTRMANIPELQDDGVIRGKSADENKPLITKE